MDNVKLTTQQRTELARADLRIEAARHGIYVGEYIGLEYIHYLEDDLIAVRRTLMEVQHAYQALENALTRVERDQ